MRTDTDKTLKEARLALAAMVQAYMLMINAALDGLDGRKTLRLCQKFSGVIRRHLKIQNRIFAEVLREDLADNQPMRLRVRRDLGGKPAMVKWEMRRRHGGHDKSVRLANVPQAVLDHIARERRRRS